MLVSKARYRLLEEQFLAERAISSQLNAHVDEALELRLRDRALIQYLERELIEAQATIARLREVIEAARVQARAVIAQCDEWQRGQPHSFSIVDGGDREC